MYLFLICEEHNVGFSNNNFYVEDEDEHYGYPIP